MGAALWQAMPYGTAWYTGSILERIAAVIALVGLGGGIFFFTAILFGAVNRDIIGQLRQN
jgi:putative peptidoglycan lipid II flippase